MILSLGVIDVAYVQNDAPKKAPRDPKRAARRPGPHKAHAAKYGDITTGDVATILEAKYGVMQAFYTAHQSDVADAIGNSLKGAVESLMMGGPPRLDAFGSGMSKIEDMFKQFLAQKEIERLGVPGVPTEAALHGVSHRFKNPYKRRPARPSFIDTGLFQSSFKAWITP